MIYYVEDDANIRDLTIYTLTQAGFAARGLLEADELFKACEEVVPEAILLDIMLPGRDGLDILREIRSTPALKDVPVMMLTAKGSEIDKVVGLDAGADDYLAKPFGMMELVSRVKALLRRAQPHGTSSGSKLACGPIVLDSDSHRVTIEGQPVALTLKEFSLLRELMECQGLVLSRAQLLQRVWGWDFVGTTRTVDVHIQTLRQKLADVSPECSTLIETVRGVGYMMEGSD